MNVGCEKQSAMTFIGFHTEIRPEEGYQKCPEFWDREYAASTPGTGRNTGQTAPHLRTDTRNCQSVLPYHSRALPGSNPSGVLL